MRFSRTLSNIALFFGAGLVSLALVEISLRVLSIHYPAFYVVDAQRGYGLRPNARGQYLREGRAQVEINSAGFRGSLPVHGLDESVYRIAVLGDSFTEALQVNEDETWVKGLQNQLNNFGDCSLLAGRKAEVLNFGVGGYGTGQSLLTWRHQVREFRPNLVILAVYPGNDFLDNQPGSRDDRPGFRLLDDGNLEQDNQFRFSFGYRLRVSTAGRVLDALINHSRLLQLLNEAKNRFVAFRRSPNLSRLNTHSVAPASPAEASPEAWSLTDALIKVLDLEVLESGARFVVISTSSPDQVWPISSERASDLFRQEQRLSKLLASARISYLPLAPLLQTAVDQASGDLFLHGFPDGQLGRGHWNESGHSYAARLIAPWLCKQ